MHIKKWNQTRLRQNKTSKLCYTTKVIKHPKGKGKHNYKYKYNLTVDGVHGDQKAKSQWAKGIIQAIRKNRSEDSEEELEEKKSWRKERHE